MRLREKFPGGGSDRPLDPEAERELAAVDEALAGHPVDADFDRLATLARDLRDERELPTAEFSAELDRWAAEGFPSGRTPDPRDATGASPLARLRERLAATPPRRILAPAGGIVTLIVVAAVGISQIDEVDGPRVGGRDDAGGEAVAEDPTGALDRSLEKQADLDERATGPESAAAERYGATDADAAFLRSARDGGIYETAKNPGEVPPGKHKYAQNVDLALATSPPSFRDTADSVLDVVRDHRGLVVSSSVSGGDPDVRRSQLGEARFQLRIPASQLGAAIADLSDLGHVVSRTDGQVDVTGRFLSAKKRIADLEASRQRLLRELEEAFTVTEQEAIRRQLAIVESNLADAEDNLSDVKRRVQLVPVSVTVSADRSIGEDDDEAAWSIGDAFDDAGRVLEVVAGILVVSAAVLIPVGLLVLLAWLAAREIGRRRRESALD
jgi:Domain of unknown function (DUF4349)